MTMAMILSLMLFQWPDSLTIDGDPVLSVLGKDAIPAIDTPVFVAAAEADFMLDDELVIGLLGEGEAKAYSTWLLDRHEIVNDVIGRTPVAVTW